MLTLTLRSDPWPYCGRYKTTLSLSIMLQIAIDQAHHSFLYFTVMFHLKGKQSVCYRWLYMSKMIPKMISLNFAGVLLEMSMTWWRHTRDMPLSTWWLEDNNNIFWTLNDVLTGHFMGNLSPNTINHVSKMELYIILSTLEKVWMLESDNFNHEISTRWI